MTISHKTLVWLRHAAAGGRSEPQALLHLLERVEALEAAQQQPHQDKLDRLIALDRREPMQQPTPEAAPVATENGLLRCYGQAIEDALKRGVSHDEAKEAGRRACYNLGRKHGAAQARCPHIRSSDEGSAWCALAEQTPTPQPASPVAPVGALAARALLERVAAMADRIGAHTVGDIATISDRAAAWLRDNPPGQPVAIEPRGCPAPGACSCMEPAPPVAPAAHFLDLIAAELERADG
jgi:hypothetical protein